MEKIWIAKNYEITIAILQWKVNIGKNIAIYKLLLLKTCHKLDKHLHIFCEAFSNPAPYSNYCQTWAHEHDADDDITTHKC